MTNRIILASGLLSLVLAASPLAGAFAQGQPGDPPGRVGRLAEVSGTVSFHTTEETQWAPASINYPVTGGNAFWTEPRSHAAIDVGASRLYMDSATELDVSNVDDQSFTASLSQGAVYLRVSPAANGDQYEIDTPRGAVHIVRAGDYEIIAGDQDHPTTVMAFNGGVAEIVGPGIDAPINSQQAVFISGQDQFQVNQGNAETDDFVLFVQAQEQPYQNQNAGPAPSYVSPQMTGYQDLNRYGQWNQDPSYGQVWYPQVAANWAPYRDGHWAYVQPWGWTWVDSAPWGFTPFHYGRWVQVRNRWAWWPGRVEARPVYAPALVTFFGNIGGLNLAVNIGGGQNVGWIPLAPEEVYVPPYRHSPTYVRNVNITYVRNETTIINVVNNKTVINNYNNFHNYNGATVVNATTMVDSRPVATDFHKVAPNGKIDNKQWADAKFTGGAAPVKPTADTRGTNNYKGSTAPGPAVVKSNDQQQGNGQQGNGQQLSNGQQQGKGKLPPLVLNGKNNEVTAGKKNGVAVTAPATNGQGTNGQAINGQGKSGQGTNGQGVATGNNNGQNNNGQNGNGQNGQNLKNGQGVVTNGSKLPPLPPTGGNTKNNQGVVTQGNGQNNNGQNNNGQNGNGQNGQNLKNGQGVVTNGGKLPPLPPSGGNTKNNQGVVTQGNGQNGNGQFKNGQNGQFQNGQNGNGQNVGQNNGKQPDLPPTLNQKNNQGNNAGQNNFTNNGGGPANQKVLQQQKKNNNKGIIPPLDSNGQPQPAN